MKQIAVIIVSIHVSILYSSFIIPIDVENRQEEILGMWRWDYAENLGMAGPDHINLYIISEDQHGELKCIVKDLQYDWTGKMKSITYINGKLRIVHPQPNQYYEGELQDDGTIKGTLTHHGMVVAFSIRKVDPNTYEPID